MKVQCKQLKTTGPELTPSLPAAGVLMPIAQAECPWWLVPSLALGGMLLIAVIALLTVLMLQVSPADEKARGAQPLGAEPGPVGRVHPAAVPSIVNVEPSEMAPPVRTSAGQPAVVDGDGATARKPRTKRRRRRQAKRRRRPRHPKTMVVDPRTPEPPKKRVGQPPRNRPRTIAEILGQMSPPPPRIRPMRATAGLPRVLSHRDINRGLARRMSASRACGRRYGVTGRVRVRLTVSGRTGRVQSAKPRGRFAAGPAGRCVAKALSRAIFRPFVAARQSFYYTVVLR